MKKIICAATAFLCFLWLLGLAGSLELNRMDFAEVIPQAIIASGLLYSSILIGGFTK